MCAIFGMAFQKGHTICNSEMIEAILNKLSIESMQKGRNASGFAFVSDREIAVLKKDITSKELISRAEYKEALTKYLNFSSTKSSSGRPTFSVIGHCRMKTQGTERDNKNNHPIVREDVVGVHNGIISNDWSLFQQHEDQFKRNAAVDSEIIFALAEHYANVSGSIIDALRDLYIKISGSYACVMVHRLHPHIVWLFRNTSPCVIYHYENCGLTIWSTSQKFIETATEKYSLGTPTEIKFPINTAIALDMIQNKFHRFSLLGDA